MGFYAICACIACGGYWFHAGDELGYPRWLGAAVSLGVFISMYRIWPGGILWAFGAQIAAALAIGAFGTLKMSRRR